VKPFRSSPQNAKSDAARAVPSSMIFQRAQLACLCNNQGETARSLLDGAPISGFGLRRSALQISTDSAPKRTRTPQCGEFEWLPIVKVSAIPFSCIDRAMKAESPLRRKHPADRDELFLLHPAHIPCLALGRIPWEEETLAVPSPALTMV